MQQYINTALMGFLLLQDFLLLLPLMDQEGEGGRERERMGSVLCLCFRLIFLF